jgi:hypothetical protein
VVWDGGVHGKVRIKKDELRSEASEEEAVFFIILNS